MKKAVKYAVVVIFAIAITYIVGSILSIALYDHGIDRIDSATMKVGTV